MREPKCAEASAGNSERESGGIVWTYVGPRETMTPFRDFGTDGHDADEFIAAKQLTTCMEQRLPDVRRGPEER